MDFLAEDISSKFRKVSRIFKSFIYISCISNFLYQLGILLNTISNIKNDFFGHSITVAGLVTGQDLIAQLKGKNLHGRLLIPSVMLRAEGDVFLDDVSREDVERELGVRLIVVSNDGAALLDAIIAAR